MITPRKTPTTFDLAQRSRRRSSSIIFCFLALFYFLAFALLWMFIKLLIAIWFGIYSFRIFGGSAGEFLAVAAVAFVVALMHWLDASYNGVRRIIYSLGAVDPDPKDRYHRILSDVVDEMKVASGIIDVKLLVMPIVGMNAFSLADPGGKMYIGVTEGLVSRLNRRQLQAVVAHEMAHLKEGDDVLVTMSCSLFGVFSQLLSRVGTAMEHDGRAAVLVPVLWVITIGAYFLNVLVSRQREYLADATAVELTRNPIALAEALYKLSRRWRGEGLARGELAPIFIVNPVSSMLDESTGIISDLFSTHPPIKERIRILLRLAHAGMGTMVDRIEKEEKMKSAAIQKGKLPGTGVPLWIAHRDGEWTGPFTAAELSAQSWINPLTWVAGVGSKDVLQAREVSAFLKHFMDREGTGGGEGCPACRIPLRSREYEGIDVLYCPSCQGVMLERGQDMRILSRREEKFSPRIYRKAKILLAENPLRPKKSKQQIEDSLPLLYKCPRCSKKMRRQLYSYQYFVEVDRCVGCGLTWFDGDELEILQVLVENAGKGTQK